MITFEMKNKLAVIASAVPVCLHVIVTLIASTIIHFCAGQCTAFCSDLILPVILKLSQERRVSLMSCTMPVTMNLCEPRLW